MIALQLAFGMPSFFKLKVYTTILIKILLIFFNCHGTKYEKPEKPQLHQIIALQEFGYKEVTMVISQGWGEALMLYILY